MRKKVTFSAEWLENGHLEYKTDAEGDEVNLVEKLGVLQAFMYAIASVSDLNPQTGNGLKEIPKK